MLPTSSSNHNIDKKKNNKKNKNEKIRKGKEVCNGPQYFTEYL